LLCGYIIYTFACNHAEKNKIREYDEKHTNKKVIDGLRMNYKIVGETNKPTIIALTGFAAFAPTIEFKSLYDSLSDKFRVIILEPFGYGFSAVINKDRTLENYVSELHQLIKQFDIEKYYLMAHSIGGLYSIEYANNYADEVLGFIGLDSFVPGQEAMETFKKSAIESKYSKSTLLRVSGLYRIGTFFFKKSILSAIDFDYPNMTDEEIEIVRLLAINNGYNKSIMNERDHIFDDLALLQDKKFPEKVPVLNFINKENSDPLWLKLHQDVITNISKSDVIEIDGGHFLHNTSKEDVVKEIKKWAN
jgi:pimeloyl-ACP methyl ester carboxylesterase